MNTEELKQKALSVIRAGESGTIEEFFVAVSAFKQSVTAPTVLALIAERDDLLAALKESQSVNFWVSCQRDVVEKCMCAGCIEDRRAGSHHQGGGLIMEATIYVMAVLLIIAVSVAWAKVYEVISLRKEVEYQTSRCDVWAALAEKIERKLMASQAEIRALESKLLGLEC